MSTRRERLIVELGNRLFEAKDAELYLHRQYVTSTSKETYCSSREQIKARKDWQSALSRYLKLQDAWDRLVGSLYKKDGTSK